MSERQRSLGQVLSGLRSRNGWTLKEMSQKSGIPVSTLSKVEHGQLSLTYDKLQKLGAKLDISMADLFADEGIASSPPPVLGRRSIGVLESAVHVDTANYDYYYLCTELRNKRMVPVIIKTHTRTIQDFGDLVKHSGEEFLYVVQGSVLVHTEFYDPVRLQTGQSIYIDSGMGHAYICADDCEEALCIGVMSSADEDFSPLAEAANYKMRKGRERAPS